MTIPVTLKFTIAHGGQNTPEKIVALCNELLSNSELVNEPELIYNLPIDAAEVNEYDEQTKRLGL